MSHHRQAPRTSRSHNEPNLKPQSSGRRSPPPSSSSLQPANKRPRQDTVTTDRSVSRHATSSSTAKGPTSAKEEQVEAVSANLDSLLDEYDLGIDQEERRRRTLEESRRKRQAILDKYRSSDSRQLTPQPTETSAQAKIDSEATATDTAQAALSEEPFSLCKTDAHHLGHDASALNEEASAAELHPDADRAQEFARLEQRRQANLQQASTSDQTANASTSKSQQEEEYEQVQVTDDQDDAEMDMFALSDDEYDEQPKKNKTKIIPLPKRRGSKYAIANPAITLPIAEAAAATAATNLSSNWDDSQGYLRTILGEMLDDRYRIFAVLGKGMFASVVRARDLQADGRQVAIKIQRVQESMYKAGLKEVGILRKLNETDPDDRKHVVRLERHFDYKGHLCMVFESLGMNLRDVVRRYGRDVGLNMQAVRAYAHQLFLALSHLVKNSVIHADIKPDNVLVSDSKALLKLCDLGSASYLSEMEITPYLVSRFYRAPEIIMGQAYDCSIDVWSTGCTLYELATGKILFPGRTNNHMLLLMQELRGRFTTKQIRKSQFGEQHFDDANAFLSMEQDKNTGQSVVRRVNLHKPTSSLRTRLLPGDTAKQLKASEVKTMNHFIDLLERCLELDPAKRIKPKEALEHPFLANV
ncbi:related to mRNA splicing-associated serine-threonine protein kinase [Ustilago sp. UG-2017b]|nr:related to mRNA splicing-associated serine-threonine protein kinase [Ustilago sp. UG-2017b]